MAKARPGNGEDTGKSRAAAPEGISFPAPEITRRPLRIAIVEGPFSLLAYSLTTVDAIFSICG